MAAILKIYIYKHQNDLQVKKFRSAQKSKMATLAAILEICFVLLLLNLKANWLGTSFWPSCFISAILQT